MSQANQESRRLLTLEAREALDVYINEHRHRVFKISAAVVVTIFIAIVGFVVTANDVIQKTARSAAIDEARQDSVQKMILQQAKGIQSTFQEAIKEAIQSQENVRVTLKEVETAQKEWEEKFSSIQESIELESGEAIREATKAARQATKTQEIADQANEEAAQALKDAQHARSASENLVKESAELAEKFRILSEEFGGIQRIMDAVREVANQSPGLEILKTVVDEKLESVKIPFGVVMTFDRPSGCPQGWQEFTDAAGRFIVGVSLGEELTKRKFRDSGGKETRILTVEQMPNHAHRVKDPGHFHNLLQSPSSGNLVQSGVPIIGGHNNVAPFRNAQVEASITRITVDSTGKSRPFSTMPPYLALFLCKKN